MNICNFCNKEFKTLSSLTFHKKTANYCIEIQKKENTNTNVVQVNSKHVCNYCNKEFTQHTSLISHLNLCKVKIEQEKKNKQEEEKNKIIKEYEEKIQQLEYKYNIIITKLELENKHLEKENKHFEKETIELKKEIERLNNKEDKLTEKIIKQNTTTIINDNKQQYIVNYNNQYNKMFDDLVPLTDDYLKTKISEIPINSLIYNNNLDGVNGNIIDYNFACNLVNILKNNVFFTDIARGKLIYKDENDNKQSAMAEDFILNCIINSKEECLYVCKLAIETVRQRETEFTDEDYGECILGLGQLTDCIRSGKPHSIITGIANKLCKNSKVLPSIKEFKNECIQNELLTNTD